MVPPSLMSLTFSSQQDACAVSLVLVVFLLYTLYIIIYIHTVLVESC